MATTRKGTQEVRAFNGSMSLGYCSFTTDGSADPSVLTDPGGIIGAVANISHSSGVYTITLADGHYQVMCIAVVVSTTGHMTGESAVFAEPSTVKVTTLTATGTPAGPVSATIKLFFILMGQ